MQDLAPFKQTIAEHFTGPDAEVTIDFNPHQGSEGQGIAWTSLYSAIVCLLDGQAGADVSRFRACMRAREREPGTPGNYCRKPGDIWVLNGHDDLAYAAVASMLLEPDRSVARAIYGYGVEHDWFFNTIFPGVTDPRSWQARHYWLVPLIKVTAGVRVEWYERVMLAASLVTSLRADPGQLMLAWMRSIAAFKCGGFFCEAARQVWIKCLRGRYPGGMAAVCDEYFRERSPNHPLSWPEIWAGIERMGLA